MILAKEKLFKIIIFVILITMLLSTNLFAIVNPTSRFYVNDYANIINSDLESYIVEKNIKLNEKTGAQIVVVTVKNLEGKSLEEYATELFRKFGIGDKNKNNGVLLLLALEERQFRIEVGYGLEGNLTDAKTGRIQDDYIIPYLKNNDWNNGVKNGFNAVLQEVYKEYNIESSEEIKPVNGNNDVFNSKFGIVMIIISFIIGFVLRYMIGNKYHKPAFILLLIHTLILGILELFCNIEGIFMLGTMFTIFAAFMSFSGGLGGGGSSGGGRRRVLWWRRLIWWWTEVQEVFK